MAPAKPTHDQMVRIDYWIAGQIRKLRDERAWSQDGLAKKMRDLGFLKWSRSVVAALENGGREIALGELVALAMIFERPLEGLLPADRTRWIPLNAKTAMKSDELHRVFQGRIPRANQVTHHNPKEILRLTDELTDFLLEMSRRAKAPVETLVSEGRGELERRAGNRLSERFDIPRELSPIWAAALARQLWGRSMTEERDARSEEQERGAPHVTRDLLKELDALFERIKSQVEAAVRELEPKRKKTRKER